MANLEVLALDEATPQIRAPGSGDGYTMPRPVAVNPGTLTTDVKVLDLSATWNNAAVTFTGLKFNATDTASIANSFLADLQVGGVSKFTIKKDGSLSSYRGAGVYTAEVPFYFSNDNGAQTKTFGIYYGGGVGVKFKVGGTICTELSPDGFNTTGSYGLNASAGTGVDTILTRDAAYIFAQRNGTNAQTFRLYRSYTDASNYQRLTETWNTSTAVIHNEGAGTGADGSVAFNDAALATDATKGFVMIPSCAGTPTGTPADIPTGQVPIVFDSTNNKVYVYDGGWLATAALT
jgi:hypothetical protein